VPANIVLLGREAYILMRRWLGKAFVSPRPRQLTGKPGVARLGNGDNAGAVFAQQHRFYSFTG
jgi:hypothetical protein